MEKKFGFTKMNLTEFETWINAIRVARTITRIQQHHTFIPSYIHFKGNNHFELQKSMKDSHLSRNFSDLAQHFSIFPDGMIVTGRSLEAIPAGIKNQNLGAICIENVGFFDQNQDQITALQKEAIVKTTALLCKKFNLPINSTSIIYHHWFRLSDGFRNNGGSTRTNKSCPGTNFFGGNKVEHCESNFLPLLKKVLVQNPIKTDISEVLEFVLVKSPKLNIRTQANAQSPKANNREAATFGSLLRVYKKQNGFLKISNTQSHWVSEKFTIKITRAKVISNSLNMRSGNSTLFPIVGKLVKNQEIYIEMSENGWSKIAFEMLWVNNKFLEIIK